MRWCLRDEVLESFWNRNNLRIKGEKLEEADNLAT